jgi:1-acyl-sn-glycerol-3-phosphate acyltransferase
MSDAEIRAGLAAFLGEYVAPACGRRGAVEESVDRVSMAASQDDWVSLLKMFKTLAGDFGPQPGHRLASDLLLAFVAPLLNPDSSLDGLEHLDRALAASDSGQRVMLICNHLSYADTICTRGLLQRADRGELMGRLCPVAGPKVYLDPIRRMGVASSPSIRVAQSSQLASNVAEFSPREVALIARQCLADAGLQMDQRRIVLLYPEGTRSRSGHMGPFLKAVARWLTIDGVLLLPMGQWGGEVVDRVEDDYIRPGTVHGRFGPLLDSKALEEQGLRRTEVAARAHEAVAALLPEAYAPDPDAPRLA